MGPEKKCLGNEGTFEPALSASCPRTSSGCARNLTIGSESPCSALVWSSSRWSTWLCCVWGMSLPPLTFHALFTQQNPFFDPYSQILDVEDEFDIDGNAVVREIDPETGLPVLPTVAWQFPHTEPALSASGCVPAECYDFDAYGASRPIGAPPYEWNPDWKALRDFLHAEGRLSLEVALELVKRTRNVLQKEPNVLSLRPPFICTPISRHFVPAPFTLATASKHPQLTTIFPSYSGWRCTRPILRPAIHVREDWRPGHDALPLPRRLRR